MNLIFPCLLFLSISSGIESFDECPLPVSKEKVDFNMIPGKWYEIYSMNDSHQEILHCFSFREFKAVGKSVYFTVENIHYQKDEGKVEHGYTPMHMIEQETSFYQFDKRFRYIVEDEASRLYRKEKIGQKVVESSNFEISQLFDGKLAFITDYKNYLIEFLCSPNNQQYLWIYSRDPNPSYHDLLRIKDKLTEIGDGWNKFSLFPSECSVVDQFEKLLPI